MNASQITTIVALALATPVFAQEGAREKIHDLKSRAEAAQAEGRADEAEKLRGAARELAERSEAGSAKREGEPRERPNREHLQAMLEKSRLEIEEAERAGRPEQVADLKHRLARLTSALHESESNEGERLKKSGKSERPVSADPQRRLQHLSEAIEHLRAAGMKEPAERLSEQAHEMKRLIAAARDTQRGDKLPEIELQVAQLREGMMNLQRQMQEMQKRLEELSHDRK